jgi:hypothetical protein
MADPPVDLPPPPRERSNSALIRDARSTLASAVEESRATGKRLAALQAAVDRGAAAKAALSNELARLNSARTSLRGEVEGLRETERARHEMHVQMVGSERAAAARAVAGGGGEGAIDEEASVPLPPPPLLSAKAVAAPVVAAAAAPKPARAGALSRTAPAPRGAGATVAVAGGKATLPPPPRPAAPEYRWRG